MGIVLVCGNDEGACALLNDCDMICADDVFVSSQECAVIFGREGRLRAEHALGVIIDGDAQYDEPHYISTGIQLITVGLGSKNTVSVSSRTSDTVTVSLNRSVKTLRGVCEPFELPIKSAAKDTGLLYSFAAKVLLGKISADEL